MINTIILLSIIILLMILVIRFLWLKNTILKKDLIDISGRKQSLSTKYGKMTENFMPFLAEYPYDSQKFKFIGDPVDGVQFEDDKIVLVEFKTAKSNLTQKQRQIKNLVEDKKVYFKTFRI